MKMYAEDWKSLVDKYKPDVKIDEWSQLNEEIAMLNDSLSA